MRGGEQHLVGARSEEGAGRLADAGRDPVGVAGGEIEDVDLEERIAGFALALEDERLAVRGEIALAGTTAFVGELPGIGEKTPLVGVSGKRGHGVKGYCRIGNCDRQSHSHPQQTGAGATGLGVPTAIVATPLGHSGQYRASTPSPRKRMNGRCPTDRLRWAQLWWATNRGLDVDRPRGRRPSRIRQEDIPDDESTQYDARLRHPQSRQGPMRRRLQRRPGRGRRRTDQRGHQRELGVQGRLGPNRAELGRDDRITRHQGGTAAPQSRPSPPRRSCAPQSRPSPPRRSCAPQSRPSPPWKN